MPSALCSTSTASFYEAKLPSEALLGPSEDCNLRIPYVFLTNGGGISESKRALELSSLLGVKISPLQVLQGHTPFKQLLNSENTYQSNKAMMVGIIILSKAAMETRHQHFQVDLGRH
ncbi:haloacid dehalogenase-like hydrolase domain-containing 5 isoform X2 [Pyrus x bretschneideri]|uniref:haloacid dehalogenase-like hydrolase domain-containing 5 isoform X2 n=1 Tax=Pyrus x bretschneideri TaxID=225117 RepID=UPI00202EBC87|nr:haloacid dehalogenase-like hydrolase domain-containing 5 isoform X2 [Pyrus x bretschneideri]